MNESLVSFQKFNLDLESNGIMVQLLTSMTFGLYNYLLKIHARFFLSFLESYNLWRLLLMIALYRQTKTPINFWYRQGLNPRSLIQPSNTLLVELTETHDLC